ncbi:hypothetical protein FQN57_003386 [Myotisia sp. PD_48]|nr:hypothetical protein FQN57_003386 [Myotisia sp. PD_48]
MATANLTSSSPSTTTPTPMTQFQKKVDGVKPSKTDINFLIMDYLVTNGYPSAANKFAIEANIKPPSEHDSIQERVEIRNAIYSGNIKLAIEKLNDLNPQLLDEDRQLHFSLLRLQLVELIRSCISTPDGDITPALDFATYQLAPRAPTDPQFIQELEETMSLLIFSPENLTSPLSDLLDPELRKSVATRVNQAILQKQGALREARLRNLVKLRVWSEKMAREAHREVPPDALLDVIFLHSDNGIPVDQTPGDVVMQEQADPEPMVQF